MSSFAVVLSGVLHAVVPVDLNTRKRWLDASGGCGRELSIHRRICCSKNVAILYVCNVPRWVDAGVGRSSGLYRSMQ